MSVVYVYGFVAAEAPSPLSDASLTGIDDAEVELVGLGAFQAVISHVSGERYAPERIEARLEDLRWVGEQGLAHERVVSWFVDRGVIVPVPLFTFYSGIDALREDAMERAPAIEARLARFSGRHEWDLKVGYRAGEAAAHAGDLSDTVRSLDEEIANAAPGRRFLLERKRADVAREVLGRSVRSRAVQLLDALRPFADEVVQLPLPQSELTLPVVLFAALLVPIAAEPRLVETANRLVRENEPLGIDVAFSGPWAPYRFIGEDDA